LQRGHGNRAGALYQYRFPGLQLATFEERMPGRHPGTRQACRFCRPQVLGRGNQFVLARHYGIDAHPIGFQLPGALWVAHNYNQKAKADV
jgi:hypothetical protein